MKTLDTKMSPGTQSISYVELLADATGQKLRVSIKSDAYKAQSSAKIERWDGNLWQNVASVPFGLMKTKEGLYYLPNKGGLIQTNFFEDRNELVRLADLILGCSDAPLLPSESPKKSSGLRA